MVCVWRQKHYEGEVGIHAAELLVDIYLLCIIFNSLPRNVARKFKGALYAITYLLAFVEIFLTERFMMLYTPTTLLLLRETTGQETWEFFRAYLRGHALWTTLGMFSAIGLLNYCTFRLSRALGWLTPPKWPLASSVLLLMLLLSIPSWSHEKKEMLHFFEQHSTATAEKVKWQTFFTPGLRLLHSVRMLQLADRDLRKLRLNMRHLDRPRLKNEGEVLPYLVLVIGESYNKYHSELYGYKRHTTPKQRLRAQKGELAIFTNVVSPWNLTSNVFKNMFSTHSIDDEGTWCNGVLFPALFKTAGYSVAFMTNQYPAIKRQSSIDYNGSFFLNDKEMDSLCFDFRNRYIYRYDRVFLHEYRHYVPTDRNLVILHLYGQHQKYDYRFGKKDVYFTMDSLQDRKALRPWMKQMLADYDNATRYNDDVINRIYSLFSAEDAVVIYLSDHGEEVLDSSHNFGRTPADPVTPLVAHYEFEAPMTIWFSHRCAQQHPEMVRRTFDAAHRPFMTDDLPHLLMGMAGIQSPYYRPNRDLLHKDYNSHRPRLLKGVADYDSLLAGTPYERERRNAASHAKHFMKNFYAKD